MCRSKFWSPPMEFTPDCSSNCPTNVSNFFSSFSLVSPENVFTRVHFFRCQDGLSSLHNNECTNPWHCLAKLFNDARSRFSSGPCTCQVLKCPEAGMWEGSDIKKRKKMGQPLLALVYVDRSPVRDNYTWIGNYMLKGHVQFIFNNRTQGLADVASTDK